MHIACYTSVYLFPSKCRSEGQIYNISGSKYVTFNGLALACAAAAGKEEATLVHYDPDDFDFGKKKAFPFRNVHFFASIEKAEKDLGWTPQFSLRSGLKDSYRKDFGRGNFRKAADFTTDDMVSRRTWAKDMSKSTINH